MSDHNYPTKKSSPPTVSFADRNFNVEAVKILPGEYFVTGRDMVLVAACVGSMCGGLSEPQNSSGIGGMNHFMLPDSSSSDRGNPAGPCRLGTAMELMINQLLKNGARRCF